MWHSRLKHLWPRCQTRQLPGKLKVPEIQLPDGAIRTYERPVSVMEIAADIHPKLAKRALAGEVGGNLVDIDYRIDSDQAVRIVTSEDPSGVE
ncbi:MAG TPA: TGS domain-containing protein, partial [Gammaproteobacteria bacterium]|nr:TGS domain-containing protein [Gammaproteobacteria bacterium]